MKKLTREKLDEHIRKNTKNQYSSMVEVAALYLRVYGDLPKIGMSGQQAEFARELEKTLPSPSGSNLKLTNRDISENYKDIVLWLFPSDLLGAFAYSVIAQNPNENLLDIKPALVAFNDHIMPAFKNTKIPEQFSYDRVKEYVNDKVFEGIPDILALNKLKPDYIDLGALARNVFYMILREQILKT